MSTSRVIRGEALGPQDEDIGRNTGGDGEKRAGSRSYIAGRFIREFIRFHVATEWIRDEHGERDRARNSERLRWRGYTVRKAGVLAG